MSNQRYQTLECVIPNATAAGIYAFEAELDSDYDFADGVATYELSAGGLAGHTMGLRMRDGKTFQDRTTINDYLHSSSVPQDRRYKQFGETILAKGRKVIVEFETFGATTSEAKYHVVFKLVKKSNN